MLGWKQSICEAVQTVTTAGRLPAFASQMTVAPRSALPELTVYGHALPLPLSLSDRSQLLGIGQLPAPGNADYYDDTVGRVTQIDPGLITTGGAWAKTLKGLVQGKQHALIASPHACATFLEMVAIPCPSPLPTCTQPRVWNTYFSTLPPFH